MDTVCTTLDLQRDRAAKLLARWQEQGWLRRIGRGLYVPVPLDLAGNEQVVTDPWVLVPALFGTGYIGGWTAAHYWDLTEQLFKDTLVFTTRRVTAKRFVAQGVGFVLYRVQEERVFGTKKVWRGASQVAVSDPERTLVDMMANPKVGGGIDHVADCLETYLRTQTADRARLLAYAERFGNGAVFKRLGFLSSRRGNDPVLAEACQARLTKGHAKLDPALTNDHLVTRWGLWVPKRWKEGRA